VAIVGAYSDPTIVSDVNQYSAENGDQGLAPGQYTEDLASSWSNTADCGGNGWFTEQTIDSEALHGMAPGANLVYVGAASCFDPDFEDALLNVVDNHLANIVSNSWAGTEDQEETQIAAYDSIFEQAATEGIGMYFSSGDAGYNDPNTPIGAGVGSDRLQANYPASSPWVTAVGGTALAIGAHGNYEFETSYGDYRDELAPSGTSWSDPPPGTYPGDFYQGSGGGTSYFEPQPSYQAGTVPDSMSQTLPDGTTSGTPMREVPDVSMDADPFTGMVIGETTLQPDGSYAYARSVWGGTSLSTPLFAGFQALAEQAQGTPIGFANPVIYERYRAGVIKPIEPAAAPVDYATEWYTNPDTQGGPILTYLVTGGIDGQGSSLLPLRDGYSNATGVGSPNYNYLESFVPCQAGACT
jgi:subtilase family serine protease